jgi:hypothetical protein
LTPSIFLLSYLGAGLSLILEIFKPCDFSFDPFFPIQESLGLI